MLCVEATWQNNDASITMNGQRTDGEYLELFVALRQYLSLHLEFEIFIFVGIGYATPKQAYVATNTF